jgi:hypothetical protein
MGKLTFHCVYKLITLTTKVANVRMNIVINQDSFRDDVSAAPEVSHLFLPFLVL